MVSYNDPNKLLRLDKLYKIPYNISYETCCKIKSLFCTVPLSFEHNTVLANAYDVRQP